MRSLLLLAGASGALAQAGLCTWCPRVVPTWPSTWALANSTIVQPCNSTGLLAPTLLAPFSIASIDWSNAKDAWVQGAPMDAETPLVQQALALHAANPAQRVWVYRNLVIAYPWFPSARQKLVDPAYAGWFLRFKPGGAFPNGSYHVPACDGNFDPPLCSGFYHSQDQTPGFPHGDGDCPGPCDCGGVPCGFYLFNHANATLRRWLLDDFVFGPTGLGHPSGAITGLYLDDHWADAFDPTDAPDCASSPIGGPTEVNRYCGEDIGLTQADTAANTAGWRGMMLELQQRLLAAGAFSWAFFNQLRGAPSPASCSSFFTHNGTDFFVDKALMMAFQSKNRTATTELNDIAAFLLVRGPYAWLGDPWEGCPVQGPTPLPPGVRLDYGVPLGNVTESADGVFERRWSKAVARMDCNTWTGEIVMAEMA